MVTHLVWFGFIFSFDFSKYNGTWIEPFVLSKYSNTLHLWARPNTFLDIISSNVGIGVLGFIFLIVGVTRFPNLSDRILITKSFGYILSKIIKNLTKNVFYSS